MTPAPHELPTSPHHCCLLVAVPTRKQDFLAAAEHSRPSDFVRGLLGAPSRRPAWVWEQVYRPVAEFAERVIADVESLGVHVVRGATLADFQTAAASHTILTLIAHWTFPLVLAADVLDVRGIHATLHACDAAWIPRLREALAWQLEDWCPNPEWIAERLNEALAAGHDHLVNSRARRLVGDDVVEGWHITHDLLEETLPSEYLRPRGVLELADGPQRCLEVVRCLPATFAGVLDLQVCHSTVLGHAVRRSRSECLMIIQERRVPLALALLRYRSAIYHLGRGAMSFCTAVAEVHRSIAESVT